MRSLLPLLVASVVLTGVPTLSAAIITFSAPLTDEQEVPTPTLPTGLDPSGFATATIDTDARTLQGTIEWQDLSSGAFMAHIHRRNPGQPTGPVVVPYFMVPIGSPLGTTGSFDTGVINLSGTQYNTLLAGLADDTLYFNLHSVNNPPGEIRGDITEFQVVPEPGTWALLAGGLGILLARHARRRS